jgi:hypothetical protein
VIDELVAHERWLPEPGGWRLVDFFESQLSRAEVEGRRAYDNVRQRMRFARTQEAKAERKLEEAQALHRYQRQTRERETARTIHIVANQERVG